MWTIKYIDLTISIAWSWQICDGQYQSYKSHKSAKAKEKYHKKIKNKSKLIFFFNTTMHERGDLQIQSLIGRHEILTKGCFN